MINQECVYCLKQIDHQTYGWGFLEDTPLGKLYFHSECLEQSEEIALPPTTGHLEIPKSLLQLFHDNEGQSGTTDPQSPLMPTSP